MDKFHLDMIRFGCGPAGDVICGFIIRLVNENRQLKKEIEELKNKAKSEKNPKKKTDKKAENNSAKKTAAKPEELQKEGE